MMTRKQFQAIADALIEARQKAMAHGLDPDAQHAIDMVALELTHTLRRENPRFDSVRFLDAATL